MTCQKIDYIDLVNKGDGIRRDTKFMTHLRSCEVCKEKYKSYKLLHEFLDNYFEIEECLNSEQIIDFIEGKVSRKNKKQIQAHLKACEKCNYDVEAIKKVYQAEESKLSFEKEKGSRLPHQFSPSFAKKDKGFKVKKYKKSKSSEKSKYDQVKEKIHEDYRKIREEKTEDK